jgi:hypothetical protein
MEVRITKVMDLEKTSKQAFQNLEIHHTLMKKTFDRKVVPRVFNDGDLVLKWDEMKSRPINTPNLMLCGVALS